MFKTKNDLPESTRSQLVELLTARLSDCTDLQTQCKQTHWNVKGPNFIALHELFDEINEAVEDYVDGIAERAVQLGGVAEGSVRIVAKRSSLPEYPAKAVDGHGHVEALSSALAAFGTGARKGIEQANELGDLDTADLFTEVSRGIDKWLWYARFFRSRVKAHSAAASGVVRVNGVRVERPGQRVALGLACSPPDQPDDQVDDDDHVES